MQLIAHRGIHHDHAENTLDAFAAAVESGVVAVETDLRLAADGQVVLFHDRLVGEQAVESLSQAELSRAVGYSVPTLAEALEAFPRVRWILELKTPTVLPATLSVVGPLVESRPLMLISFWHSAIVEAARRIDVDLGLSIGNSSIGFLDAARAVRECHRRISTIVWNYEFLDPALLTVARAASWRNFVFGAISAADHAHCRTLELDGLITDRPELLASSRETRTRRGPR